MSIEKVLVTTKDEEIAIKKLYGMSEEEVNELIKHLQNWLQKQPHLPQDEDEKRLKMMLYYNKFSLEKTKAKLDTYYSVKHIIPEFYAERVSKNSSIDKQLESMIILPLPYLTSDLHRVTFIKWTNPDPSTFNINVYMNIIYALCDLRLVNDLCLGDHYVYDCEHIKIGHLVQCSPVILKKAYVLLKKAYSDRVKGIHFLNLPSYAEPTVAIVNSLLSKKLANRIITHKNVKSLSDLLSQKVLPNEYNGTAGPINELYEEWKKYFYAQDDWLAEIGNKKSDESKRIGEPFNSEMFGMCGSFRKLDVD